MANFFRLFFILFLLLIVGPVFGANGTVYATGSGSFEVPEIHDDFYQGQPGSEPEKPDALSQTAHQGNGFWEQILQFVSDIRKNIKETASILPILAGGAGAGAVFIIMRLITGGKPALFKSWINKLKRLLGSSPSLAEKIAADPHLFKAYQKAEKEILAYENKYAGFIDPVLAQEIMYKKLNETGKLNESEMKTILDAIYVEKQAVFASKLKELEKEIKKYKDNQVTHYKYNYVNYVTQEEIDKYICDFMRYPNYTDGNWERLCGLVDVNFIKELQKNNYPLYAYFCYAKNVDPEMPVEGQETKEVTLTDPSGNPVYVMNPVTQSPLKEKSENGYKLMERNVNSYDLQHMFATCTPGRFGGGG
ncbi:MAG: hypothetical protein WB502_09340 [Thermoactinomyces sp.]